MRKLNNIESLFLLLGAVIMVIASAGCILNAVWSPYVFTIGALSFVLMQLRQSYEGSSATIKRLRHIQIFSCLLFLITAVLMGIDRDNLLGLNFYIYLRYVHNNWVVTLLIAALLQLYTTHRISSELDKEAKKS